MTRYKNTRYKNLNTAVLLSLAVLGSLSITTTYAATTTTNTIKSSMKQMKQGYRTALNSSNMAEFISGYEHYKNAFANSAKANYGSTASQQQTYSQGIKALQNQMLLIEAAIKTANLNQAKLQLQQLRQLEKDYHKKLDV